MIHFLFIEYHNAESFKDNFIVKKFSTGFHHSLASLSQESKAKRRRSILLMISQKVNIPMFVSRVLGGQNDKSAVAFGYIACMSGFLPSSNSQRRLPPKLWSTFNVGHVVGTQHPETPTCDHALPVLAPMS